MSIAGANNAQTGQFVNKFYYTGGDYKISKYLLAQDYYGNLNDFYRQHFLGLTHTLALGSGSLKSDLRYFNSGSDGKNGCTSYLITDRQIGKFANAGERTWLAEYAYDFAAFGVSGFKTAPTYLSGDHIDTADGDKHEWERDVSIDYALQTGGSKALGSVGATQLHGAIPAPPTAMRTVRLSVTPCHCCKCSGSSRFAVGCAVLLLIRMRIH